MPEWRVMKVTVVVEFEISGSETEGALLDQAVQPVKALKGAKVVSATIGPRRQG